MKPESSSPIPQQKRLTHQLEQPLSFRQVSLNKVLRSVQTGNCCRVLGPRYRFKSKLMRQAAAILQENGAHFTAYQSLAEVELNSESSFFASLYAKMQKGLFPTQSLPGQIYPGSASEFQQALLNLIAKSDRNLAVFIDDLEIAPPNLVALLLGALRAVFTTVIDRPGARFQAVVCGSLSLSQIALANASRFESISDLVLVDDLDETERLALTRTLCQEAGFAPTMAGLRALLAQTGGDISLIKRVSEICFDQMKRSGQKKVTPVLVVEAIELFLNGQLDWIVIEALRQIESNPSLLSCALRLLKRSKVPAASLPIATSETPTVLDLCGIFSQIDDNHYKIKCKIWSRVLRQHLTPARVGGLYAIAGYWQQAITYLGQAVQVGQYEVKSELFTATINAMHASENTLLAFGYLARGLQAIYPGCDLLIYHRTHEALELVYPQKRHKYTSHVPMNDPDCSEIEALDGPDYSIVSVASDPWFLLPLRTGSSAQAIGLVSLGKLSFQPSPHQQREEILQLTSLLHQAARAIETKDQVLDLLNTANERADKLKTLNSILTRILHHRDPSEEAILHLALAGVTSGWGLEFNRAILFMIDENRQRLLGRLGVGHLTRREAEADWETFSHPNLDALVDFLLTHQVEEKSLHQMIKYLTFSLESPQDDLLTQSFKACEPILSSQQPLSATLPEVLLKIIERPQEFALIPLRAASQTLGILYVDDKFTERPITPERFELLQTFVNQAALALENARALAIEKKQTNILAELLKVEELVNDQITTSIKALFDEIVRSACRLIDADCTVFYPLCPDNSRSDHYVYEIEQVAYWGTKYPLNLTDKPRSAKGMAAWIIREGLTHIPDVKMAAPSPDKRKIANSPFVTRENIQAFVGVRLGPPEKPVGILYINWRSPHLLTKEELSIIQIYANFVTVAIPSARRYQQVKADLERRQERLETMARITSLITSAGTELESDVLRAILHEVKRAIPQAHNVGIIQFDADRQNLVLSPANLEFYRVDQPPVQGSYRVDTEQGRGIAGRVIESGQVVIVPDVKKDLDYITAIDSTRSALGTPIKINGETQAALILESNDLSAFSADDKRLVEMLADHVAIAVQSIQQFQLARERQLRERIATLATGLIHDINSAVASIPDLANEVEEKLQSGGDITAPLADLRRSALKAGKISSRLRDFVITRQFKPTLIEVETVIQNALNISLDRKPMQVTLEYKPSGLNPEIIADVSWVELLLHNLILNAYDAIPTNQCGVVEIEVDVDPTNVLIRIKDNGKGITSENLPRIIEPGFTTKQGSGRLHGFGLYYCHQVVKEHHGDLKVKSIPSIGTIFTVILPKAHSSIQG
jgi:signal transduction histidine kinase